MLCQGLTKKGIKCTKKVKVGDTHCHFHKDQVAQPPVADQPLEAPSEAPSDDCCVCLEETKDTLVCKHYLCRGCVNQMTTTTCPMCRGPLKAPYITDKMLKEVQNRCNDARRERSNALFQQAIAQISPFFPAPPAPPAPSARQRRAERRARRAAPPLAPAPVPLAPAPQMVMLQPPVDIQNWLNAYFFRIYAQ